jgi:hypothetical protein
MISPEPLQRGHGEVVTIWPMNDWRTRCTCPEPRQSVQVTGWVPSAAPVALQVAQATAVCTSTLCWQPNTACSNSRSTTTSRSAPRGGPCGPRLRPPKGLPPKKASKMSLMLPVMKGSAPGPSMPSGPNWS